MSPKEARIREVRGFTLLEILVVVVIIGLLAGFVAPRYFGQVGKSEVNAAKAQIDALGKALDQYRLDTGNYPSPELGLKALVDRPPNEPKWNGPYLRKAVPLDPWGKPYVYKVVDGVARLTEVRLGGRSVGQAEITDGLAAGDVVVTAGQLKLFEGARVRLVDLDEPAPAAGKVS